MIVRQQARILRVQPVMLTLKTLANLGGESLLNLAVFREGRNEALDQPKILVSFLVSR